MPLAASVPAYAPDHGTFASGVHPTYRQVCMLRILKVNQNHLPASWLPGVLESRNLLPGLYGKLEKQPLQVLCGGPERLLTRHLAWKSEMSGLLCCVIVVKVDLRMQFSPCSVMTCEVVSQPCSQFRQT